MSHKNRITRLLTGASLAALSLVGGRSALGATLTGTGTAVIATDTDFVRIEAPADYDRVTNNAIISDGFDDNIPGQAVAVWVTANANVDVFINNNVIEAIEGTAAGGDPTGNNGTTNAATATGMLVDGTVPLLINDGLISGLAVAHDTATSASAVAHAKGVAYPDSDFAVLVNKDRIEAKASAYAVGTSGAAAATADAFGVGQNASGTGDVKFKVVNRDEIRAYAKATASAANAASAYADAIGVHQSALNLDGNVNFTAANSGYIGAGVHAVASGSAATAYADAFGVDQTAYFVTGDAKLTVANSGKIGAYASADASATGSTSSAAAGAAAVAVGVDQAALSLSAGDARLTAKNSGEINAYAKADASGMVTATADAAAVGVGQTAFTLLSGDAKLTVSNSAKIGAYAKAAANGIDEASARAQAFGVNQGGANIQDGDYKFAVDNSGYLGAVADASASADAATADAFAWGVAQNVGNSFGNANLSVANSGSIRGAAYAAVSADTADAGADAWGIAQGAFNVGLDAKFSVDNSGYIGAYAESDASGVTGAAAEANARGAHQNLFNVFGDDAELSVDNSGYIHGAADAFASGNAATATGNAWGIEQSVLNVIVGDAKLSVDNSAHVDADAKAKAIGVTSAYAAASVYGANQHANTIAGAAALTVKNSGYVGGDAHAFAAAAGATAQANALGAAQSAEIAGSADLELTNSSDGVIDGSAGAVAIGQTSALAAAVAFGAVQSANQIAGAAELTIANSGYLGADAHAFASASNADAVAIPEATVQLALDVGTATLLLANRADGEIGVDAKAVAIGKQGASATAYGFGPGQGAHGIAGAAELTIANSGHIGSKAHAFASATGDARVFAPVRGAGQIVSQVSGSADLLMTNSSGAAIDAEAKVEARGGNNADADVGIIGASQGARTVAGDATLVLKSGGDIGAKADAYALAGTGLADADGTAYGALQTAYDVGGAAELTAKNSGHISGTVKAVADGANAAANADADGIGQTAIASSGGMATLWVDNWGGIDAYAGAKAFAKSTASARATAVGVSQFAVADLGTAEIGLDNHGDIEAKAVALAESTSGSANDPVASATGANQSISANGGNGVATAKIDNDGDISAYGSAKAFAKLDAEAHARAEGADQFATATGIDAAIDLSLTNEGRISGKAHTLVESAEGNAIGGGASTNGFQQSGFAPNGGGTVMLQIENWGDVESNAEGKASAAGDADMNVSVDGVDQGATALGGGGRAEVRLDNWGWIKSGADSLAVSISGNAEVDAFASGVEQEADANEGGGTAKIWLGNEGSIEAKAHSRAESISGNATANVDAVGITQEGAANDFASNGGDRHAEVRLDNQGHIGAYGGGEAFAKSDAFASVTAFAVIQRANARFGPGFGTAEIELDNHGDIEAKGHALAESSSAAATAIVSAVGVYGTPRSTDGGTASLKADNSGTIKAFADAAAAGATASAAARARGIVVEGAADNATLNTDIHNSGVIVASAKAAANGAANTANAFATGILINGTGDGSTKITNDGGTIWAGRSVGGVATRGNAINVGGFGGNNPAPNPVLMEFKGNDGPGHIFGDIALSQDDRIEVTEGKTYFDGIVIGQTDDGDNSLDIFDGGNLVLCLEGWSGACDPGGWAEAGPEGKGYDPQAGTYGPSYVVIDTFAVGPDGTLTYQLTPNNTPGSPMGGDYAQVYAGTAELDGTLKAVYLPAFYAEFTRYEDIIFADTRTGEFDQVVDNSIFLDTNVIYDNDDTVDLTATRNAFDEVLADPTKNQGAVSSAIENVYGKLPGPGVDPATQGPFAQLVANLFAIDTAGNYQLVLDQLSGAQYAQYLQSLLWSLRALDQSITDRMDCSLNRSIMDGGAPEGCFTPHQVQTWVRAWGGWNDNDGDINAPGYSEDQFGIWVGADYALNRNWFVGAAAGYFDSEMSFDQWGGVNGGSIDYDGGQVALYGGFDNAVWYNRAIVKFGWYDGESHRNVGLFTALDPSGTPDADVVDFYNEVGRRFALGGTSTLTPYFGITVAHAEMDGFIEKDPFGTGAALKVASADADSVATALGLRYNGNFGAFKPQVAVAWEHEFEDTAQTVNMTLVDAPAGANFKTTGTDLDEDSLLVEAGGAYALGTSSDFSVRYFGRFLSDYDAQSVMGRFTYKFGGGAAPMAAEPLKLGNK